MIIDNSSAAVDTDFIIKVAGMTRPLDKMLDILREVFSGLGINAIIHPLVYKNELTSLNEKILAIFDAQVVSQPTLDDIFQGDAEREAYYCYLVPELFKALTGIEFPTTEPLTYWKRQTSLGEIHSVTMCLLCMCGLFLSDDQDSKSLKQIVEQRSLGKFEVYNRQEVIDKYIAAGNDGLQRADRRAFAHQS